MITELEAKFLDIDIVDMRDKLSRLGAELIHSERLMKRRNFDYDDMRIDKVNGWIRIRDEGERIMLAYKQLNDRTLYGTKEITLEVEDFEKMELFFKLIGLKPLAYQETKREMWMLDDVEITIDTWPWIPSFVELEGMDETLIKHVAKELEFNWENALYGSVEIVYQKYYDVTEKEVSRWNEITFSPVPDWLEAKKYENTSINI